MGHTIFPYTAEGLSAEENFFVDLVRTMETAYPLHLRIRREDDGTLALVRKDGCKEFRLVGNDVQDWAGRRIAIISKTSDSAQTTPLGRAYGLPHILYK